MTALETMQAAYRDRDRLAREHHAAGGKVVAYMCDNVPAELIRAAGMMPYRLSGDASRSRSEVSALIGSVHTTRLVGLEFMDATTARFVAGDLDFADYVVVPHNRKQVQVLGVILESIKVNKPDIPLPEFHYLDRTYVRDFLTSGYNRKCLMQLVAKVEEWSGAEISADAMRAAIAEAAETRRLLREVNALRQGDAPRVSGVEALEIYGASHFMEPQAFQKALTEFIAEANAREPLSGKRVYMGGSPLDHTAFYRIVEDAGAIVVAEDHCWGARCAELTVGEDGDPFEALAARFVAQPACSLRASIDDITDANVARARASGAQGAIYNVMQGDTPQMWETPSQLDALREGGMPCLHLKRVPYRIEDPAPIAEQVSAFVAELGEAN